MDFSEIGMLLVYCGLTAIFPLIPTGFFSVVNLIILLVLGFDLTQRQFAGVFLLLYVLGFVASCLFFGFLYLAGPLP